MPSSAGEQPLPSRERIIFVFLTQGLAGALLLLVTTFIQRDEPGIVLASLGRDGPPLIAIFLIAAALLQLLRFDLSRDISASLELTAHMAMLPLLGVVISSWIAVIAAVGGRWLSMQPIGPLEMKVTDRNVERARAIGLFATFGIPVIVAGLIYRAVGGITPFRAATPDSVSAAAIASVFLILTNVVVMLRPVRMYGYSARRIAQIDALDASIYMLSIPYATVMTAVYPTIGWGAVLALAAQMIVVFAVTRQMAVARTRGKRLIQRLASLTNVGRSLSLRTKDDLLMTVYDECRKVMDASIFTIAIHDAEKNELCFELDVHDNDVRPNTRLPVGEGLNSWVVTNGVPLLIRSAADEKRLGIPSVDDGTRTESWLGVPMIARNRILGVISLQSYRKNAFSQNDQLMLTSIANQTAVALDNSRLYENLENLTYELEERVQRRTNELQSTNERLQNADRTKNEFLAKMSHELRTPLNSIIGFSSVLLASAREQLPPRFYKFVENIHAAGHHLLELINDILDLSKIEAGRVELRAELFDLRHTIASVERVMRGVAGEGRVSIVSTVDDGITAVRLDEGRLKQILFNLLSNAVKFSPPGGMVYLTATAINAEESELRVASIRIDVADQGAGISPDEAHKIFEEFYQSGRTHAKGGTGLGLSLTRNFVELHAGRIGVSSEPNRGAKFSVLLPVDIQAAKDARTSRARQKVTTSSGEVRLG